LLLVDGSAASECPGERTCFRFADYGVSHAWHTPPAYSMGINVQDGVVELEDYEEPFEGFDTREQTAFRFCLKSSALDLAIPKN
jgi:hypothetical protein